MNQVFINNFLNLTRNIRKEVMGKQNRFGVGVLVVLMLMANVVFIPFAPVRAEEGGREEGTYRLYFITDTHLENADRPNHTFRLNALKHFIDAVNNDRERDLAFHLGDLNQGDNYQGIVDGVRLWSEIEPTGYLRATVNTDYAWHVLGNHEVNTADPDNFAHKFIQTEKNEGGSIWNSQFTYTKYKYTLHFVMMDCLFDSDNKRSKRTDGLHEETISWMRAILQTTDCNMVILLSHAMPHFHDKHGEYYWGNKEQGVEISDLVKDAIDANENLEQVVWFAGHWHGAPWDQATLYTNLGDHLPGYRIPPAQDATARNAEKGVYSIVEICPQGIISIESILTPAGYGD